MPCAGEGQTAGCAAGTCQVLAVRAWCLLGIPPAKIPHENRGARCGGFGPVDIGHAQNMGYVYSGQGADGSLIAIPSARSAVCVGPMDRLAGACWNGFKIYVNINIGRAQGVSKQGREQAREGAREGGREGRERGYCSL